MDEQRGEETRREGRKTVEEVCGGKENEDREKVCRGEIEEEERLHGWKRREKEGKRRIEKVMLEVGRQKLRSEGAGWKRRYLRCKWREKEKQGTEEERTRRRKADEIKMPEKKMYGGSGEEKAKG